MKKSSFLLLAFIALAASSSAQIYHYHTNTPWYGNKSYILNAGFDFNIVSGDFGSNTDNLTINPGLSLSFRYEGDKNINEHLSWGYQLELSCLSQEIKYDKPISGSTKVRHFDMWTSDYVVDARFSLSYWINDKIELQAAAGIFLNPLTGNSGESYEATPSGNEVANSRQKEKGSFSLGNGVSTMLQAKYFFTENFFLSLNIHDNIDLNLFGNNEGNGTGGQRGIVMVGVGYKVIR